MEIPRARHNPQSLSASREIFLTLIQESSEVFGVMPVPVGTET
jgi:hypothetical protein